MLELVRELRNLALSGHVLPAGRFFKPTEAFFKALEAYQHLILVEAGTGMGHVPEEARKRGFRMLGLDIARRDGQAKNVLLMPAEDYAYSDTQWLMMCRPDHSGWAYDTLEIALKRGAGAFYVGLERNLVLDLGDYLGRQVKVWQDVGQDGEAMYLFMPESLRPDDEDSDSFSS